VTEPQLEELLRAFLADPILSATLDGTTDAVLRMQLSRSGRVNLSAMLESEPSLLASRPGRQLRQWLTGGEPSFSLTFSVDAATTDRSLAFLTPTHPLIRLAVNALAPTDGQTLSAQLQVTDASVPVGHYLFAVDTWETIAARPEFRAVGFAVDLSVLEPAPQVERRLLALLAEAHAAPLPAGANILKDAHNVLNARAEQRRRAAVTAATETSEVLVARRLASLEAHNHRVGQRLAERVAAAVEPRIARMRNAQREHADLLYRQRRQRLEKRRGADVVSHRIAEGALTVIHEQ
jgi:hypothetical protein